MLRHSATGHARNGELHAQVNIQVQRQRNGTGKRSDGMEAASGMAEYCTGQSQREGVAAALREEHSSADVYRQDGPAKSCGPHVPGSDWLQACTCP